MTGYPQLDLLDNSPMGLVDSIVKRIEDSFSKSWWYPNEYDGEKMQSPQVYAQYLPKRDVTEDRDASLDYPLVCVIHSTGAVGGEKLDDTALKVEIFFGGWDNDKSFRGWRIPCAMMWAVLQDILNHPFIGAFQCVQPMEWTLLTEESPPYFNARLSTTWKGGAVVSETGPRQTPSDWAEVNYNKDLQITT